MTQLTTELLHLLAQRQDIIITEGKTFPFLSNLFNFFIKYCNRRSKDIGIMLYQDKVKQNLIKLGLKKTQKFS